MKIGISLPHIHKQAFDIAQTAAFARQAEQAGVASLWVGDRNFAAVDPKIGAGGMGNTIPVEYNAPTDPFVVLAAAATATERVTLGTHVLVAPLYPPAQLARSWTSLDLLSGGRVIPGFGVGWSPEEYEAAGLDFSTRGARMNEVLDALEIMWSEDPAEYHGRLIDLPRHHAPVKPVQRPRPPIYLGATNEATLRRVGERGDGWLTLCMVPSFVNVDMMKAQRAVIDESARQAGRDPAVIETVLRLNVEAGSPMKQVADTIKTVGDATGIEHFFIETMFVADTAAASLDLLTELMPLIDLG